MRDLHTRAGHARSYARGDHVRPVWATVGEPRIPLIYPWGVSKILNLHYIRFADFKF